MQTTTEAPRIVKRAPRPTELEKLQKEGFRIMPAGVYRVIHGSVVVPRPHDDWHTKSGKVRAGVPKTDLAGEGDEVFLSSEDATRLFRFDIIETLDTHPSRVGKVFDPPKAARKSA